jgi:acetyltransferase-like isoleucine patch superfamily enzyme
MQIDEKGSNNVVEIDQTARIEAPIRIYGQNNKLIVGKEAFLTGQVIEILGNNCSITLGDNCVLRGLIRCRHNDTHVYFGKNSTSMHVKITLHEAGRIKIGEDCMISGDVRMDVSDMHSIIDRATGQRINKAQDIEIGDHVWLGYGVTVAKGCHIGSGSVVAEKSLARGVIPSNVVVAGAPAKVIRENIEWRRDRI